ncbi:sialate O-acetylesterase [Verrucomicrobiales bacterium BCK34]|nr:sialate O-acetylesterase [Verrucomicrobiales bacterium BCK34]
MKFLFTALVSFCLTSGLYAGSLKLNSLFTNQGVLQQELPVPVFGSADPLATVTVAFEAQSHEVTADENGEWIAILNPLLANAKGQSMTVTSGAETVVVEGLLIGEVWVGSGQSNMAMAVRSSLSADEAVAAAASGEYANIRLFKAPVEGTSEPLSEVDAEWKLVTPETVSQFSATAFFFGARLSADRSVPVGLIQAANGGTNAYSWINSETLASDPTAAVTRDYWSVTVRNHPDAMARYKEALAKWIVKRDAAKKAGESFVKRAPREPLGPDHVKRPAGHYNAMVAPLQPYAIRGVIWYQGEANSRPPFNVGYRDLMFALVEDWRADWAAASHGKIERRDFPFYMVQLPNFANGDPEGWPIIREQMLRFWEEGTNTGMVVAIDKGEAEDIHPRDKKPIGERLARFARANTYGENIVFSGPVFDSLQIDGAKAVVSFKHPGGGLASLDGDPLKYFEIAGADGEFVPAVALIEGNTLVVSSGNVAEPRAVRYAWSNNPEGANFGNAEGLPASPFRTDSW